MMSLSKTVENNGKMRTSPEPNKIYIIRKVLMRAIQKCNFHWIWATVSKVLGIFVKFNITTNEIWSCHVTLASNSENFYLSPNSILNFKKVTKFGGNWLKNKNVTGKKQIRGGKHPVPSAYRVKFRHVCFTDYLSMSIKIQPPFLCFSLGFWVSIRDCSSTNNWMLFWN